MAAPVLPVSDPTPPAAPATNAIREVIARVRAGQIAGVTPTPAAEPPLELDPAFAALPDPSTPPAPKPETPATPPATPGKPDPAPTGEEPTPATPDPEVPPADPAPTLTVEIPGRQPGEVEVLTVGDQATAERLTQLRNGYLNGQEVRAARLELSRREEELQAQQERLQIDPLSYLVSAETPQETASLALQLLALPGVYEAVQDDLRGWEDEPSRRARRAELERDYLKQQDRAIKTIEEKRVTLRAATACKRVISALVPPGLSDAQRTLFLRDANADVANALPEGASYVNPRDVPAILEPRLAAYGMTREQIQRVLLTLRGSDPAIAPPAPAKQPVRLTGTQLVESRERRDAAVLPPPGHGAPGTPGAALNPNDSIQERIRALKASRRASPS